MLGLREFSLAALVQQYFGVTLVKGSQKANWARRPLPHVMAEYAKNDTHYLLPLAAKMEEQLAELGRTEWFRQSCRRALEQAAVEREKDPDQAWRIAGSGILPARTNAVLRALWHWRDQEAQRGDRPAFHILQNSALIESAVRFVEGEEPDFRHFSDRRRAGFLAAARAALALPESEWPQRPPRVHKPRIRDLDKRVEELKQRRDKHAAELALDPSFIASRGALEIDRGRREPHGAKSSCPGSASCSSSDSLGVRLTAGMRSRRQRLLVRRRIRRAGTRRVRGRQRIVGAGVFARIVEVAPIRESGAGRGEHRHRAEEQEKFHAAGNQMPQSVSTPATARRRSRRKTIACEAASREISAPSGAMD